MVNVMDDDIVVSKYGRNIMFTFRLISLGKGMSPLIPGCLLNIITAFLLQG